MTLYEIDSRISGLVDPDTGELLDYDAFAELQMERESKIENMVLWYKDLISDAKAIKDEADSLTERRKAIENKAERLKSYLDLALDGQKFQTPRCMVTFRKTSSIQIEDQETLLSWLEKSGYENCIKYRSPEISKTEVGKLLKSGVDVPFARIQESRSLGVK